MNKVKEHKEVYYDSNGNLWYSYHSIDGFLWEGECKNYNPSGNFCFYCYYKNDLREGEFLMYG